MKYILPVVVGTVSLIEIVSLLTQDVSRQLGSTSCTVKNNFFLVLEVHTQEGGLLVRIILGRRVLA